MFVRQSKYNALKKENAKLEAKVALTRRKYIKETSECIYYMEKYNTLIDEYNTLLRKSKRVARETVPFNKEDIARLITLCHPDKHGGKASATEMTQKLLEMRGKR
jgi:integrase